MSRESRNFWSFPIDRQHASCSASHGCLGLTYGIRYLESTTRNAPTAIMTTVEDDSTVPSFRFKRRKTTHTKRARIEDDTPPVPDTSSPNTATPLDAPGAAQEGEASVPNLNQIIRNRKRPRDRLKDVARRPETTQTELVQAEAPRPDKYSSRFVAQTGQIVDSSDKHM